MSTAANLLQYILPVLAVIISMILLCFYHYTKGRRGSYDVTPPSDGPIEMVAFFNRVPPGYSITDPPPPYTLFDPKVTITWPGAPPPYEVYPVGLPAATRLRTGDSCGAAL